MSHNTKHECVDCVKVNWVPFNNTKQLQITPQKVPLTVESMSTASTEYESDLDTKKKYHNKYELHLN